MIQAGIKCFERSTVERIEENSNDVSRCLFYLYDLMQINTHKYGHGEMRNKKLINRGNDITQGKEGEKRKKKLSLQQLLHTFNLVFSRFYVVLRFKR